MKKRLAMLLTLAMMGTLAGGATTVMAEEPVELSFFIWDEAQAQVTQEMIDLFEQQNENISVELTVIPWDEYIPKMQTVLATHTGPDICWLNTALGAQYVPAGGLVNLSKLAAEDGYTFDHLNQNILDAYSYQDEYYGMPKDIDTVIVVYNKELFDKAGVAYPSNDWTWEEFRETAKALNNDEFYGYTNNNDERVYYSLIQANGGSIYNEDGTASAINNDIVKESVQFLIDMYEVDQSTPSGGEYIELGQMTHFLNEMAAMDITGSWNISVYAEALGDKLGIAEMPTGKVGKSSISHGIGYAIPEGCEHVAEAWEFLKFLGSDEAQLIQAASVIPANNNVAGEWAKLLPEYDLSPVMSALEYSPIMPLPVNNPTAVRGVIRERMNEVWLGESDVATAVANADADINAEIAK